MFISYQYRERMRLRFRHQFGSNSNSVSLCCRQIGKVFTLIIPECPLVREVKEVPRHGTCDLAMHYLTGPV